MNLAIFDALNKYVQTKLFIRYIVVKKNDLQPLYYITI